jgi:hypothetical protein
MNFSWAGFNQLGRPKPFFWPSRPTRHNKSARAPLLLWFFSSLFSPAHTHAPPTALWLPLLAGDAPLPLCPGLSPANPTVAAFRNHFLPLTYIAAVLYRARPGAPWSLARPRRPALLRPAPLFDTALAWPPLLDLFRLNTRQAPPRLPMANPNRWGSGLTVTLGCPCCGDGALMVMLVWGCLSTSTPTGRCRWCNPSASPPHAIALWAQTPPSLTLWLWIGGHVLVCDLVNCSAELLGSVRTITLLSEYWVG